MNTPKTRRERDIWQVCDGLVATGTPGNKVTGDAIREQLFSLGLSKGSPNEIYKYRKSWREARGIIEEDYRFPTQEQIILTDPLARAVEMVRNEIRNETLIEIESIRKTSQEETRLLEHKTYEIEQELNQLREKNQYQVSENVELKAECRRLQIALAEETQQKSALEQRVMSCELAYEKLEKETDKILYELKQSHLEVQQNLKKQFANSEQHYRKELEEYKNLCANHQQQREQESDRLKTTQKDLDIKLGKVESQLEIECQKNHELTATNKRLEFKIESLKQERKNQVDDTKDLELKLTATETELKQIKNQLVISQDLYSEVQQTLQKRLEQFAKLEERNRQLQAIITEKYFNQA
jgi:hypothetical protein